MKDPAHVEEYDASFTQAVEQGRAEARRGELLEHDAVVERIERLLTVSGFSDHSPTA